MKRLAVLILLASALPAGAQENFGKETTATAQQIVATLAAACPMSAPETAETWEACRDALLAPDFAKLFAPGIQWGDAQPGVPVWEKKLRALDSDTLRGGYLPMFSFSGGSAMSHEGNSSMVVLKLHARYRKTMPAIAHANSPYELFAQNLKLNELVFRIDPATAEVWTVMYAEDPEAPVGP